MREQLDDKFRAWSPTLVLLLSLAGAFAAFRYLAPGAHPIEPVGNDPVLAKQARATHRSGLRMALFMLLLPIIFYALGTWRQFHLGKTPTAPANASQQVEPGAGHAATENPR